MRVVHLSVDGSVVTIEADADLSQRATATGWAIVPSLMRSHPFTIYPSGHSQVVERHADSVEGLEITSREEFNVKGSELKVVEVVVPTATKQRRALTLGAWEGKKGCLTTSLVGHERERLVEVFDTLQFSEGNDGIAIDSPVVAQPRILEVFKEIPEMGILAIRPAVASELQRIPKSRGAKACHCEVFRLRKSERTLVLVSDTTVVNVDPLAATKTTSMLSVVESLRIEWSPRGI